MNATRLRGEADAIRTRKRLTEAQQKLTDGKPADAADDLQKILDESGDDLVLVKDDNYQPARRLVQQYLAALPTDALTAFRNRIDAPAKKLLEAGRTKRDPQPLLELLGRYFVSRPAEEALLLLGELEFERGDFTAAERHWRRLLPDGPPDDLKYPEPKTDPAVVRAKLILAQIFRGDRNQAEAELGRYRTAHPKASGPLAGGNGNYADTLTKLIATPPQVPSDTSGWTAFAGNVSRDGKPDRTVPRYWHGRPEWKTAIPRDKKDVEVDRPSKPPSFHDSRPLAFHPVVLNGSAYIADAGRVYQFDLKTGAARLAFHFATLNDSPDIDAADLAIPCLLDADFTLTVANGKLYARLGPPTMPVSLEKKNKLRTYLVALEPKPAHQIDAEVLTLTARWQVAPPVGADGVAAWEGAPVVAN
ncbi:MAG: hypothetical protein Q8K72_18025, partial [Acidimicrobiales bacterium]|nr:hypothetical protein [Acidimicrobiales bacterium]